MLKGFWSYLQTSSALPGFKSLWHIPRYNFKFGKHHHLTMASGGWDALMDSLDRFSYQRKKGTNCMKPYRDVRQSEETEPRRHKRFTHPPELKGKAIGLWYRDQHRRRLRQNPDDPNSQRPREKKKEKIMMTVKLSSKKQTEIEEMLEEVSSHKLSKKEGAQFTNFQKTFLNKINVNFEEKLENMTYEKIPHDPNLDEQLYNDMVAKQGKAQYKNMLEFRHKLPSYSKKNKILNVIKHNQIVLISGETGCGKSTQIVQYVLDDYIWNKRGSQCNIICTQPRRISAISVSERVAAERAEKIGESIGYVIRLENELPKRKQGIITFVTTGVLIQFLQSDPVLSHISHLFIDEIHERDTICDFLLTLLKYIMPKRPDLRVVLMSATLNAQNFSNYFGGIPIIEIPGFTFPVEEIYLEQILQKIHFSFPKYRRTPKGDKTFTENILPYIEDLEKSKAISRSVANELKNPLSEAQNLFLMADVIEYICENEPEGAILVFVPGLGEIQDLMKSLSNSSLFATSNYLIIPMHSIMPTINQKEAFVRPPRGVRKIVIATNIAETSITIDDIVYVVDGGRVKLQNFDLKKNVVTLEPDWETKANAKQRKGRAGRTQPGKCYKLFTKAREDLFDPFPLPEIQRTRLEEVILNAKTLQLGRIGPFLMKVMDPPDPKAVELSLKLLQTINALDSEERLTPLGFHLSKLPMDPQTGKMIIMGALFSCIDPILSIAACLNFKDPFVFVMGKEQSIQRKRVLLSRGEKSDHYALAEALREWEEFQKEGRGREFAHDNFLSHQNLILLRNMKKQFANHLKEMNFLASNDPKFPSSNVNSDNVNLIKAIICSGLYPNVAMIKRIVRKRITGTPSRIIWRTEDLSRVTFHSKSILDKEKHFESPFVVFYQMMKTVSVSLHDATMVYPMALLFFGARLDFSKENKKTGIRVDDMIRFDCSERTSVLVKRLRSQLLEILESTVSNPSVVNWEVNDMRTILLKAIVELITTEDKTLGEYIECVQQDQDQDEEEDEDEDSDDD